MAIYADTFTDEQLAGFQDFFRIPVGQPWVEKQSEVMIWILQIWQSKMADIMPPNMDVMMKDMPQGA